MIDIESYFYRQYHSTKYNCLHFAREVWRDVACVDIMDSLSCLFQAETKHPKLSHFKAFKKLDNPQDPCLVLLTRPRFATAHIGIYIGGKILHIHERGVEFQPLEIVQLGFKTVRFYS